MTGVKTFGDTKWASVKLINYSRLWCSGIEATTSGSEWWSGLTYDINTDYLRHLHQRNTLHDFGSYHLIHHADSGLGALGEP